jgi:Flp pilus assembly protein TadG
VTTAATTRRRRLVQDDGMASVLLLLLTPALFALGGLVLDGGTHLAARQRTAGLAEQAARAGADQLDTNSLRATGTPTLDEAAAIGAACRFTRTVEPDATCTASVTPTATGPEVQVRLRSQTPTVLLGLIGVNSLHTDATGTAQAVTGIRTTGENR